MSKDHKDKISEIMLSYAPVSIMNTYINQQVRKTELICVGIYTVSILLLGFVLGKDREPNRQEVLKAARPLVDSIQNAYQMKMDFMVDSLVNNYENNITKK